MPSQKMLGAFACQEWQHMFDRKLIASTASCLVNAKYDYWPAAKLKAQAAQILQQSGLDAT